MKNFLLGMCFFAYFSCFSQSKKSSSEIVTLSQFDFKGKDSLITCQIIEKYRKLTKYINNLVLNEIHDDDVKYSTAIAINRLLASSDVSSEKFGFEDFSLEEKSNFYYNKEEYIKKLKELKNTLDAYSKIFLANNCVKLEPNSPNILIDEMYYSALKRGKFNFLESTKKSLRATSKLRGLDSTIIVFNKIEAEKTINVRLMKVLKPDIEINDYKSEYKKLYDSYSKIKFKTDSTSIIEAQKLKSEIQELENEFVTFEITFTHISEEVLPTLKNRIKEYKEQVNECACAEVILEDKDNDGFDFYVDCDDNNPNVYPGAPINCNDGIDDNNCDSVKDLCCMDKDGDGYYRQEGCDCLTYSEALLSTVDANICDCNDDDASVYPNAPINCLNFHSDDNCDGVRDTIYRGSEVNLSFIDNIYPPYGISAFGKDRPFYIYTGLIVGGIATTAYFKIRSNYFYQKHMNSETFRSAQNEYKKANELHHAFIITAAATGAVYLTSLLDLKLRYSRYNSIRADISRKNNSCVYNTSLLFEPFCINSSGIGPAITLKF
jgi:hypothetical protein